MRRRPVVPRAPAPVVAPAQAVDRLLSCLADLRRLPPDVRGRLAGLLETEARSLRGDPDPVRVWAAVYDSDDPALGAPTTQRVA